MAAGLTNEILEALRGAKFPMTVSDLLATCEASENTTQIAGRMNALFNSGAVLRTSNEAGRFEYRLNPEHKRATTSDDHAGTGDDDTNRPEPAPARVQRTAARRAEAQKPRHPDSPPPPAPARAANGYVLFDHIAHAMRDLDDLVTDALDHGATPEVVKCVVASQGALRRAQEAIYREARAA